MLKNINEVTHNFSVYVVDVDEKFKGLFCDVVFRPSNISPR